MAPSKSIRLVKPGDESPLPGPIDVDVGENKPTEEFENGASKQENPDGSLTIDFSPRRASANLGGPWFKNLADDIETDELSRIANDLLTGIQTDDMSRKEWMETRARGIVLLGFKLEEPKGDIGGSSAPLEGMSTIRHPLLAEAVLRFQANARGELLPATGPVKVRNDTPTKPKPPVPPPLPPVPPAPPSMGHNGGPPMPPMAGGPPGAPSGPMAPPMAAAPAVPSPMPPSLPGGSALPLLPDETGLTNNNEELADALEKDMNHYLTATATEYYPDTDRMLFWVGAGGMGFKKVYNCPIRRRPVSESVDAADIIVSNASTDLENCGRVTHRIKMRPSVLKRMQIVGAYRDVEPLTPSPFNLTLNSIEKQKNEIQGTIPQLPSNQEDIEHELYETYCELNIKGFEHKHKGKETGLCCPYKVTIHKESRKVLEVRRNWEEKDQICLPKQYFVEFPFVRAMGFYGIGLIHIAGNTTSALTATWREMLDAGMFASFPGFIYAKSVGRQLTNQFRVPPGGGIPLEIGTGRLQDNVMPLPYKEPGPAFTAFAQHVEEVGQRVAGTAEVQVGEGNQEVPVGTTLALIEQSTKVIDAVHKRLHAAQAQEFKLLKERFKEDPEAFWRHNKRPTIPWRRKQFLNAIENSDLIPVADPNNPTSLHRIAKATAIKTLQQANPAIYDPVAVDTRIMRIVGIDPEGLFHQNPQAQPPDPKLIAAQQKAEADKAKVQIMQMQAQMEAVSKQHEIANNEAERQSREKIEGMKLQLEQMRIQQEAIIHAHDAQQEQAKVLHETQMQHTQHIQSLQSDHAQQAADHQHEQTMKAAEIQSEHAKHQNEMALEREKHHTQLQADQAQNERTLQSQEKQAASKPKPAAKKD